MLVGLALIAIPLLAAILDAGLQIRNLADTGQRIIVEGVSQARASQALFSQVASLERTARLYDVLNDPKLLDVYRTQDERLTGTRGQLQSHATKETRRTLDELGQLQASIRVMVLSTPPSSSAAATSYLSGRFTDRKSVV
jgi:hypothetical protein